MIFHPFNKHFCEHILRYSVPCEALTTVICFSFAEPGVNDSIKFYCEAKNTRGISVSRTGTVHIKGETYRSVFYCFQCNGIQNSKLIVGFCFGSNPS